MGVSGNPIDLDLIPANIVSGVDIFGVVGTAPTGGLPNGNLPTDTISLLGAATILSYGASTNIYVKVGFLETASFVYAVYSAGIRQGTSGGRFLRLWVQKIDKSNQQITNTYISECVRISETFGSDTDLTTDTTTIYLSRLSGSLPYISFDTGTDTFSSVASPLLEDSGIANALSNLTTGNVSIGGSGVTTYTTALTAAPGAAAPTTLVVSGFTYGVSHYYNGLFTNAGNDSTIGTGTLAFVTYT